jgi:hypothetical protein
MGSVYRVFAVVLFLWLMTSPICYGQTFSEFFRQKKTQEKYLLTQIAYLELYGGYVRQGYEIARSGLGVIRDFSSVEFDLHKEFFASLKQVNPLIKKDVRALEVVMMQDKISKVLAGMNGIFLSEEALAWVDGLRNGLLEECEKDLDALLMVMSADVLEMSDQQRLSKVIQIHQATEQRLGFVLLLFSELKGISLARENEKLNLEKLRRLYENN